MPNSERDENVSARKMLFTYFYDLYDGHCIFLFSFLSEKYEGGKILLSNQSVPIKWVVHLGVGGNVLGFPLLRWWLEIQAIKSNSEKLL